MALVFVLLLVDRGAVLAWSFGVAAASGRVPLVGAGVLLGAALVAALGGFLLLVAQRLAGTGEGARPAGRAVLGLAVLLAGAGLLLAAFRVAAISGEVDDASRLALAGVAGAVGVLAGSLLATRPGAPPFVSRLAALALPLAALGAVALAIALAVSGVLGEGTYATPAAASAAATALLGLSALETTGAPGLRRFAFLLALLALAVR
jgi:hypothetical protein